MNYAKITDQVNFENLKKALSYIKRFGLSAFYHKAIAKIKSNEAIVVNGVEFENPYQAWIEKNEPDAKELNAQRTTRLQYEPKISIVVPVYETPEQFLKDMVESVLKQTYSNWELCIADGGSKKTSIIELLEQYSSEDNRIKIKFIGENKGIAGNSNEALSLADGDYIVLLDHDDMFPPFALFEVVKAINDTKADFLYSDEDKITEDGEKRLDPHFKPDWSPDTLRSYNYITHLSIFKKELLNKIGVFREGFDGSQDYDLILRATEQARQIVHIPKVLYHWRISGNSTAGSNSQKLYACEAAKKALREHIERIGLKAEVKDGAFLTSYRVIFPIDETPKISIIIPNKDHITDLSKCLNSILKRSTYQNYEIIIVENNSEEMETFKYYEELLKLDNIKIITWNKPFNYSAINNFAVKHATGEYLLFLNNDTEVINSDWMESLLEHVQRKGIGACGAKLYYPDDLIQHGGVVLGIGGVAGHSHKYFSKESGGHMGRLRVIQNLSAVTGACLMMRKEVFEEIGGFDERFFHAFNDVDLCMKIRKKGYLIVWTPYVEQYHHESKSRGNEDTPEKQERFRKEIELFKQKWGHVLERGDPYYNPNLSLDREDFSLRI